MTLGATSTRRSPWANCSIARSGSSARTSYAHKSTNQSGPSTTDKNAVVTYDRIETYTSVLALSGNTRSEFANTLKHEGCLGQQR